MSTPLLAQLESLGRAMDEDLISRDEAITLLVEWRQGGLTELGAADLLMDWRDARERYRSIWGRHD